MGLFTARQPDDRGRRVPIINMYGRRAGAARHEGFTNEEFKRIRRYLFQRSATTGPFLAKMLVAIVAAAAIAMVQVRSNPGSVGQRVIVGLIHFLIVFIGFNVILQLQGRSDAKRMRVELVYRGRCASCGYLLTTLQPEDDGCTVCPECGAAWKLRAKPE